MSPALSIVIPAYNEAARLPDTLQRIFAYLNETNPDSEVIVVDDGSSDSTAKVAESSFSGAGQVAAQVVRNSPNRGKGFAVRTGMLKAKSPIVLFSDADLSTPITETPKVVQPIQAGTYDVVFGSRAVDRSLIGVHQPWRREQAGRVFNAFVRLATRMPYTDTQCGFKAFRMSVCRPLIEAASLDRFGFDVELLYMAHLAGLRLREEPVRWDDKEGSKVGFLSGLNGFEEVRLLRRQARNGFYDRAIKLAREILAQEQNSKAVIRGQASEASKEGELLSLTADR